MRPTLTDREHVPTDIAQVIEIALDMAYYRSVPDDAGLGAAAWYELRSAVSLLPEAPDPEPTRRGPRFPIPFLSKNP